MVIAVFCQVVGLAVLCVGLGLAFGPGFALIGAGAGLAGVGALVEHERAQVERESKSG